MVGAIAALLDTTIVNVGLDAIARDLHTTVTTAQWVITGYLLSCAMVIPLSGWAIARFGAKATWLTSLTCSWPARPPAARPGTSATWSPSASSRESAAAC